jgi:hypothetical protein
MTEMDNAERLNLGGIVTDPNAPGRVVIELDFGITVYPPQPVPEGNEKKKRPTRWRAVWYEEGQRQQCESVREGKLAAKLEEVKERLEADAPKMKRSGADLIAHYLDPDRLPADRQWSRKHAHTQRRLCERFATPVIGTVTCQEIKTRHMQQIVNAAPTAGEGARVAGMISALVGAGIKDGYLANPRLAKVHWQSLAASFPPPRSPWPGNRRCGSTQPRSRPTTTSASSARRWPTAHTGTSTN